jgi:predicted peroxiredoxin
VNRPSSGAPDFTRWHHGRGGKVGSAGSKTIRTKEDEMRLLYIVTKGMEDPTLASVPLHIAANGSLDIGQEVSVVLAGDATDLVIEDNMQRLEGVGVPPARELLGKLKEHEVPVYV